MKIIFISKYAESADLAFRMAISGHDVRLYIDDAKYVAQFDGIVKKTRDWKSSVRWADFAFFDDNGCSHIWEQVHKQLPCFGGSSFGKKLENDRSFAHSIMKRAGLQMNECLSFKTLKEAIGHLKEHQERHVIKPQGGQVESHHLVIGERDDNADAIDRIELMIAQGLKYDAVEVEKYQGGVEAAVSIWFNGSERVGPVNLNFEFKRSHDKDKGYLTAEMGTLMRYLEDAENPFYQGTLEKIIPTLRAADYHGQIDLGFKVTSEGYFPTEFTPRIGKPSWALEDELHISGWAELAYACAVGKPFDLQVRYDWAVGVVLAAFGFPHEDKVEKISKGRTIDGLTEHNLEHLHPWNVELNKKGKFVVGRGQGQVLVATGSGERIEDAKRRAYEVLGQVKLQDSFHRHDISDKISTYDLDDLGILPLEESRV